MSNYGSIANYGGRQPDNFQNTKQFVNGNGVYANWIFKKQTNGLIVQTPVNKTIPVYINSDLYVNGSIYNTSDALLKDNIVQLSQAKIDNLLELNPITYTFKHDLNKHLHIGFLAQDVEKLYPELVQTGNSGYKTINYIEIIPLLVSKIKTMQNEIDTLKTMRDEIDILKGLQITKV
jgi:hypothetical protein